MKAFITKVFHYKEDNSWASRWSNGVDSFRMSISERDAKNILLNNEHAKIEIVNPEFYSTKYILK